MIKTNWTYTKIVSLIFIWEILFWVVFYFLIQTGNLFSLSTKDQFVFLQPTQLYWLGMIALVVVLYLLNLKKNEKIIQNSGTKFRTTIFNTINYKKSFIRYFLFRNAIAFLIIALAQPAFGTKKVSGSIKSMELVVCLDVSNSMNTFDIDPNLSRLSISKRAINELVNRLSGEKIGITIFAGDAFTQLPLTLDYSAVKMFVNEIETNMISQQGTNINKALENAHSLFSDNKKMNKAILLITDGENHDEDPFETLKNIKKDNIQLAVLGVGTKNGGLIPIEPEFKQRGYKKNAIGNPIQSKLNPKMIEQLAQAGDGIASICENPYPDLQNILKQLKQLKNTSTKTQDFEVKQQRYQIPLLISLVFFTLYFWGVNQFILSAKK